MSSPNQRRGQQKRKTHIMNAIVRRRNLLSSSSLRRPLPVPSHTAKEKEGPDDSQGQGECESSTKEPSTNRPNRRQVDGFDALSPGCGQSSTTAVFVVAAHGAPGCSVIYGGGLHGRREENPKSTQNIGVRRWIHEHTARELTKVDRGTSSLDEPKNPYLVKPASSVPFLNKNRMVGSPPAAGCRTSYAIAAA
jgi:hypothetical protein